LFIPVFTGKIKLDLKAMLSWYGQHFCQR